MAHAKSASAYTDIEAILDTVLRSDQYPAVLKTSSPTAAKHWRFRANSFRTVLRHMEEEKLSLSPGEGTCIYDHLVFAVEGSSVLITSRDQGGTLEIGGQVVTPTSTREREIESMIASGDFILGDEPALPTDPFEDLPYEGSIEADT